MYQINVLYCKHHLQLGPHDVMSFPSVNDPSKGTLFPSSLFSWIIYKKLFGYQRLKQNKNIYRTLEVDSRLSLGDKYQRWASAVGFKKQDQTLSWEKMQLQNMPPTNFLLYIVKISFVNSWFKSVSFSTIINTNCKYGINKIKNEKNKTIK